MEKDPALGDELRNRGIPGLIVVEGDILDQDWPKLMEVHGAGPGPYLVVGNLPYSISTPLLYLLLDYRDRVRKGVFLVQREVAERYIAGPGGKDYSPLGILLQIYYNVKILFKVSPGSFVPPPKVDSAVISLERREAPLVEVGDFDRFRRFLHACFAQRRKTLGNNLAAAGYPTRPHRRRTGFPRPRPQGSGRGGPDRLFDRPRARGQVSTFDIRTRNLTPEDTLEIEMSNVET